MTSQVRSDLPGVANARACSWNRPPIDRMANLNLEPGDASFEEMIASVERGVYMQTNCSWSIDDSRNKFQFGCEYGQLIEDGKLTHGGQKAELPRHFRHLLAQSENGRQPRHRRHYGHAELRQGRA